MGMFDLPANPWQPQTNIATKLRELYVRLGLLGNNRQQDIQNAIQDPAGVAERLAGTVNEYIQDPMSYVGGGIGHIAYHGSPYKFDKFSLDKIGTGEGAQAYGHGLYLAESPEVARSYLKANGSGNDLTVTLGGKDVVWGSNLTQPQLDAIKFLEVGERQAGQFPHNKAYYAKKMTDNPALHKIIDEWKDAKIGYKDQSALYKTDIPDEAVARFLDWDKPLSQQAPEVQAALQNTKNKQLRAMTEYANVPYSEAIGGEAKTMGEAFRLLNLNLHGKSSADSAKASALLAKQGIPGIRYLDGGSRSGGAGTSNFVAFDPEMIRILERNGIPTGNQPWKPGEFNIFKDTTESAPLFRDTTR